MMITMFKIYQLHRLLDTEQGAGQGAGQGADQGADQGAGQGPGVDLQVEEVKHTKNITIKRNIIRKMLYMS